MAIADVMQSSIANNTDLFFMIVSSPQFGRKLIPPMALVLLGERGAFLFEHNARSFPSPRLLAKLVVNVIQKSLWGDLVIRHLRKNGLFGTRWMPLPDIPDQSAYRQ
jgi:hypothetical protein